MAEMSDLSTSTLRWRKAGELRMSDMSSEGRAASVASLAGGCSPSSALASASA